MRRLLYSALPFLAAALLAAPPARAQSSDAAGFAFLGLEPSARAAALGGAAAALPGDDVNGLFYNPALLSEAMHRGLSVSYLNHVADVNAGFVAYAHRVAGLGTVAAGVRFLSWGDLAETDETGAEIGSFGAGDVALTLGASRAVNERLRYGASLHLVHSRIAAHAASALGADVGVHYHLAGPQLTLGASLNNLGRVTDDLGETEDRLPFDVRISAAKRLEHTPLLLSVTAFDLDGIGDAPAGQTPVGRALHFVALGGELQFSEAFQARFGYNHRRHSALKTRDRLDLAGASVGFGLKVSRVRVDYAFNSWSEAGSLHQLTVRTRL